MRISIKLIVKTRASYTVMFFPTIYLVYGSRSTMAISATVSETHYVKFTLQKRFYSKGFSWIDV